MTRTQLIDAIKREARVKNSTDLDTMIGEILDGILSDYCLKADYYEMLKTDITVTTIAATGQYALPADFQKIKEIRFAIGSSPVNWLQLLPRTDTVRRTYSAGRPYFYFMSTGNKINIFPYDGILTTDQLKIDYYILPSSVFSTSGHEFPIARIQEAVKKETVARIERYHNDNQGDQLTSQDATTSFVAAQSARN